VLDELVLQRGDLPGSRLILPFLGIYRLVALKSEKLKNKSLLMDNGSTTYQILDGKWTALPHGGNTDHPGCCSNSRCNRSSLYLCSPPFQVSSWHWQTQQAAALLAIANQNGPN
jgi:hypothetical protein